MPSTTTQRPVPPGPWKGVTGYLKNRLPRLYLSESEADPLDYQDFLEGLSLLDAEERRRYVLDVPQGLPAANITRIGKARFRVEYTDYAHRRRVRIFSATERESEDLEDRLHRATVRVIAFLRVLQMNWPTATYIPVQVEPSDPPVTIPVGPRQLALPLVFAS